MSQSIPFTPKAIKNRLNKFPAYLPVRATWIDSGLTIPPQGLGAGHDMAQPFVTKIKGQYLCYYEYNAVGGPWFIGLLRSNSIRGPWTSHAAVLSASGVSGAPDEIYVADPTVQYINGKYHMWFDMGDLDNGTGILTTIGHATSDDGIVWTKQATDGVTDAVIARGPRDYDIMSCHAPESFIHDGVVHLLYACQGTVPEYIDSTDFNTALAVASDSNGLGTSFRKYGQVTWHNTSTKIGHRLSGVVEYNGILYGHLAKKADDHLGVFVSSGDWGKTWKQICECPVWFHSFLLEDNILWAIAQNTGKLYYIDLLNFTVASESSDTTPSVPVFPPDIDIFSFPLASKYFYSLTGITSSPRTATVDSVSTDTITLTGNDAYKFFSSAMYGNVYLKIANITRDPKEYAWVKRTQAVNTLQVTDASAISSWQNGDTITTAYDGATSDKTELDISPLVSANAIALLVRGQALDTTISAATAGGVLYGELSGLTCIVSPQVANINNFSSGIIPIGKTQRLYVRDIANTALSVVWGLYGYLEKRPY